MSTAGPRLLVVGGCSGLVGRAVRNEFLPDHRIRSVHRTTDPAEAAVGLEFQPVDVGQVEDWRPYLREVDDVLILAWWRQARRRSFQRLADGLLGLVRQAEETGVRRLLQVSVPEAPDSLETGLPYLAQKRRVDRAVGASGLDYVIVRPSMLFGPRDVLATVLVRLARRYHRLPMFGEGDFHVSPLAVADLASILRRELDRGGRRTVDAGGPRRWTYRDLTEAIFRAVGRPPKYLRLGPRGAVRLARVLERFGSSLVYAYEVEWLLADQLGLSPYTGLSRPLSEIEPFLAEEARRSP